MSINLADLDQTNGKIFSLDNEPDKASHCSEIDFSVINEQCCNLYSLAPGKRQE